MIILSYGVKKYDKNLSPHQIYKFKDNLKQILLAIPSVNIQEKKNN